MKWSPVQQRALDEVGRWLRDGSDPVYYLAGYAGTGKTTLAKYLAQSHDGTVLFGAFTGKAASVLRSKGCDGAMTIHQMIYHVSERSGATLRKLQRDLEAAIAMDDPMERIDKLQRLVNEERKKMKQPAFSVNPDAPASEASLIVIDECSMVNERMGEDLLSFNTPVLVLGDQAQLPPVRGGGYFTNQKPNLELTEIHRQARDNPIIDLATRVRRGETLPYGNYGDSRVIQKIEPEDALTHDQILVGTNKTRRKINLRVRELSGLPGLEGVPWAGERIVCLRNDHDAGLLNGEMWRVLDVQAVDGCDQIGLTIKSEAGDSVLDVVAHRHHFEGREEEMCPWIRRSAQEFDFGYAITTHKAQGSQWGSVLVFDESRMFRSSKKQWLYTAITRAAERVTVVRQA